MKGFSGWNASDVRQPWEVILTKGREEALHSLQMYDGDSPCSSWRHSDSIQQEDSCASTTIHETEVRSCREMSTN